jgi:ATP-dependent RNA helicase DeaD
MDVVDIERALGPELWAALARKGYAQLTSVQEAVLDPALEGRDLRITSQTGSGKTLAIGFALRPWVLPSPVTAQAGSLPRALVVAPTRELARQTQAELGWLYADCKARVVAITGGASFRDERRELARGPAVVVGTPGRLLDHLGRGSIDPSALAAIVLDEADRLLDMGFREDLDAILGHAPPEHRTHLVSATFPRAVRALADRVQRDAAHVEGTRLGAANADIDNVIHVIETRQKVDAIINLLLASPQEQTLVFARTRADVASLAQQLANAGFAATAISGELDQAARNRALSAFKHGRESVLVATDVAARGIDVQDVTRVIQTEPPTSPDAYTHRAGRTGRAGRKGTSHLLISAAQVVPVTRLLRAAGIAHRFEPIPSAEQIRRGIDERIFEELAHAAPNDAGAQSDDLRAHALARRLLACGETERILARLLQARYAGSAEPRDVRPPPRHAPPPTRRDGNPRETGPRSMRDEGYVPFVVSWGGRHGADARRLLAIACRRGEIRGSDVGAIRVEADHSIVEVARSVAGAFATHAARPDPRDRRVLIRLAANHDHRGPQVFPDESARPARSMAAKDGRAPLKRRR